MLVKVTRLNYDAEYVCVPAREEALVNTDSIQSVTSTEARGSGPFCLLTFQDGTQMTVVGTPEGLLKEWYEAEYARGLELAKVRVEAVGPPLLLQSEPMTYQPVPTGVAEAVAAEREECAKVADNLSTRFIGLGIRSPREMAEKVAMDIRARGQA